MARDHDGPGLVIRAARGFARGLAFLFGRPSWQAPPWARAVGRSFQRGGLWARADRARAVVLFLSLGLTVFGGVRFFRWWDHRPKPVTVAVQVIAPELTRIEEKIRPKPLHIEFDDSVAPLEKIDKPVSAGVSLEVKPSGILGGLPGGLGAGRRDGDKPEGVWRWASDRELTFAPKNDWPIGQEFVVRLAKKGLVASHVRLARYELPFKTAPFAARISEVEFYQDPVNASLKKVVATFQFSHPVDPSTFDKRVKLHLIPSDKEDPAADYAATITYDRLKGAAYVHSAPITVPRHDAVVSVTLAPGTAAARGGPPDDRELSDKVTVPGLYNLLKITSANLTLVDNDRSEPQQALIIETSVGVADKDLAGALHVTLLPEKSADGKRAEWYDPSLIGPDDLKRGSPVTPSAIASETEYPIPHSFRLEVPVGRKIYLKIDRGVRALGGYLLAGAYQAILEARPFPQMLRILQNGALLASGGDRKLPVLARDVPAIKYEIGRVLPGQIQHLVTQTYGDFAHPGWSYRFDQTNLTEVFEEVHKLAARPGKPEYDALDLSKYVTGQGSDRRGLFLLRAQSWDPAKNQLLGEADSRLILVSDLGLLVKQNADGTSDAFVESIRSGTAISGAHVEVLGKNGQRVLDAVTDGDGHARLPSFAGLRREKEPVLLLVSTAKDQSFLPVGRGDRVLDTSRFDVGGVSEEPTRGDAKGLSAFLFSDRGLYRPGDEIRLGLVVKTKDWSGKLGGLPLQVVINDARGLPVKDQRLKLSPSGFEEIRHTTPEVAPAGTYSVNVYVVKDDQRGSLLGSTTVEVREFLPDRMKIHAALSRENPEGWVSPQDLRARVTLANLFGTPATKRKVRLKLALSPWMPAFGRWRDYHFFDPLRPRDGVSETLADAVTDDDGATEVNLQLQRFAAATYRLTVTAEGFEAEGGRSVVADVSAVVSPLPFLVGYKTDGDLSYMNKGADRAVELIAISPSGKRVNVEALHAVLFERKYVSVLARQDKGIYRYQSVRKEIQLSSKPLEIRADGSKRKLPTDRPGDFTLVIRDGNDQDLQKIDFSVTGYGNLSREVEKNAELQIALKRADLAPGDELEMQIKAPYTGSGLITIERDRVYAWKWFKTTTTASVEHIRVPEGLEGGGYLSVAFVRDPGSDEVFMSPLSHGVVPFSISRAKRRVNVQVEAPEAARPGEPLRLRIKADKPARAVVFAVDEGILRVGNYQTPDPLAFFFTKRALSVKTAQILDLILPEFQRLLSAAAPGGDLETAAGANLNPFRRKQQKPVAYWSGIVDVGPKERELTYDVPDYFNGTLRVMAVAVAPEALGAFERRSLVRGDFVISPNAPTFLSPGDETEVSVAVTNSVAGSGKAGSVTLSLAPSANLEVVGARERKLTIPELREASASFRVKARAAPGPATLTFTATLGAARGRLASELSVRPAAPYLATFQAGHLRQGGVTVPVARRLYPELRRAEAGLSHLPLGLVHGLRAYLEKFPHGCTEQIVSQAVPPLILGRRPEFGYPAADAAAAVERWVALLRTRQNQEGSFGRWAANPDVDKLASVWATHILLEAKDRGLAVPAEMLKNATAYLQGVAATDVEGLAEAGVRAYATYVLTRAGVTTGAFATAEEKHLQANHPKEWRHDVAGLYLGATYRLLKQDRAASALMDAVSFGKARPADRDFYVDRLAYDAQALYLLARHFPERAAKLSAKDIDAVVDPIFRGSYNTYSSAWSIMALEAYGSAAAAASTTSEATLSVREVVGGQSRALALPQSLLPLTAVSPAAGAVHFDAGGPFGAYWVLAEAGFDREIPSKPESRGLEVFRTYEVDGKTVGSVKLGDEVTAVVRLRTLGRDIANHLAIIDLLPGGFEAVVQARAPAGDQAGDGDDEGDQAEAAENEGEGEGEGQGQGEEGEAEADHQGETTPGSPPGKTVEEATPYALPVALPGATLPLEFGDVRDDRVVLYGSAGPEATELRYVIKATNVGVYTVAPIQATALYDSGVMARGLGGKITVVAR